MKRILLTTLALGTLAASAQDLKAGYSSICVQHVNGETTTITLTDQLTTQITATHIVFADAANEVNIPLDQLRSYSFVEAVIPEGIDQVPVVANGISAVYTADGRQLPSLQGVPAGLYIVKCGKSTMKVYRK